MIYLSEDYIDKYINVLCYLLERAVYEEYSFDYIVHRIAYSTMINELERSNVTLIAFSSSESLYSDIFPEKDNKGFVSNIYGVYGWIADSYIHLFLKLNITFELLFIIFPLEYMVSIYPLYHEMSFSHLLELLKERTPFSYLDIVMRNRKVSTQDLADATSISFSTLNAIRYNKRDINKLEAYMLLKISKVLSVKLESLLNDIYLSKH